MEYGLWNLPTGFWQATGQSNMPMENVARPSYYATAALPLLPPALEVAEGDVTHMAAGVGGMQAGAQCYRPPDFLPAKNMFVGRATLSSNLITGPEHNMLHMGTMTNDLIDRSMESVSSESQLTAPTNESKTRLRRDSDSYENPDETSQMEGYTRQQSFQHPMYGMLLSQLASGCKDERALPLPLSDDEDDIKANMDTQSLATTGVPDMDDAESIDRSAGSSRAGYECGECGMVADTRIALKKHLGQAHPDAQHTDAGPLPSNKAVPASVLCPVSLCRFRAADPLDMENHVAKHVTDGMSPGSKKKPCPIALQRVRYEREEYRCQLCSYSCTIEKAYHKHLKIHSMGLPAPTKISCVICGKDRFSEVDMNKHMKKHRDDRYFCCDICIFKTVQLKKLIQHRRMHTGEKPHLCPHCSYRSARRDNLRSHVRRVHKKDNIFCDTFSPRSLLLSARPSAITGSKDGTAVSSSDPPHSPTLSTAVSE